MHVRDYIMPLIVVILLTSTLVPIFSGSGEDASESSSVAPFEEFNEPVDITEKEINGTEYITLDYTYEMDYDVVPEDLVVLLNGTCSHHRDYLLTVKRPDEEEITLNQEQVDEVDHIDETYSLERTTESRDALHSFGASIMRGEGVPTEDIPPKENIGNLTKVLFGKANEDILRDTDPLKGEYHFSVRVSGQDIEMDFGEDATKLAILSYKKASEPRNLEGTYEDGKVELKWDEPEDQGGSEIMQYNIYRATSLYNYQYVGKVSGDSTEYVDDFDGEATYQNVNRGDILYYKVVAINEGDYHYLVDSMRKRDWRSRWTEMSIEEIVHLSHEDKADSDMSYKWVMNYSALSEESFADRVNMDDVTVNKMHGGDVFLYDINRKGEEDGEIIYEYEGGFVSQGEVDMELEGDENVTSDLNIEIEESWCDFSGEIRAEDTSDEGYEKLSIVEQTIQSEGKVKANVSNNFDFNFYGNRTNLNYTKQLDIEWSLNLTLEYEGDNGWIISREDPSVWAIGPLRGNFNYSGSIDAGGTLRCESNHLEEEREDEGAVSKEISGTSGVRPSLSAGGSRGIFSPIVGATNLGYYMALNRGLNKSIGPAGGSFYSRNPSFLLGFSTESQRDDLSTERLYGNQYVDPMALPGMGSFLGMSLKRANLTDTDVLEDMIESRIRQMKAAMEEEPEQGWEEWEEQMREELKAETLEEMSVSTPWAIQQTNGLFRLNRLDYGGIVVEPLGYFASEPLSEDEIASYNEDREQFFQDQMAAEEDSSLLSDYWWLIILVLTGAVIILGVMRARSKETSSAQKSQEESFEEGQDRQPQQEERSSPRENADELSEES